ncbi:hypothetical protein [Clostridium thermarum]|uniref:hypothetical protein n=1 Tax=Clostridium thermarum TaxID=1716543 RepID=UPI0013D3B4FC|nr:hypothetical protein [Clostridium thermarum]
MYFSANTPRDVMEKVLRNRGLGEADIKFALDWLEKAKRRDEEAQKKEEGETLLIGGSGISKEHECEINEKSIIVPSSN